MNNYQKFHHYSDGKVFEGDNEVDNKIEYASNYIEPVGVDEENMTLYQINDRIEEIIALYGEEDDQHLEVELNELEVKQQVKLESIAHRIKRDKIKIEELEEGIKQLTVWRNTLKQRVTWLSGYTLAEMVRMGIKKFKGKYINMSRRKKPMRTEYATDDFGKPDVDKIASQFLSEVTEVKVDVKGAKEYYLKHKDDKPNGFTFIDDEESLIVK